MLSSASTLRRGEVQSKASSRSFPSFFLSHPVNPDPKVPDEPPSTPTIFSAKKSLNPTFSRDGHSDLTSSDAIKNSKLFKAKYRLAFSPATGGKANGGGPRGGSNLEMITRPSNEMLDHWLYSAACSRSSPTAQPGSHHDNRQ